ncbi:MAG: hypothetical protein ACOC8E_00250 [Planctomycetota bacterium]
MPEENAVHGLLDGVRAGFALVAVPFLATLLGIHLGHYVAGDATLLGAWPPGLMADWVFLFLFSWVWLSTRPEGVIPLFLVFASAWWYWWRDRFRREAFIAVAIATAPLGWGQADGGAPPVGRVALALVSLGVVYVGVRLVSVLSWWWAHWRAARKPVEEPPPSPSSRAIKPSPPPLGFLEDDDGEEG